MNGDAIQFIRPQKETVKLRDHQLFFPPSSLLSVKRINHPSEFRSTGHHLLNVYLQRNKMYDFWTVQTRRSKPL